MYVQLASIFSCVRLSESPTSSTMLKRRIWEGVDTSICLLHLVRLKFESWGKKDKPRLKLCVLSNILIAPTLVHPGGFEGCGGVVNSTRATERRVVNSRWVLSWTELGMYLMMKLWSSLYVTLNEVRNCVFAGCKPTSSTFVPLLCQARWEQTPVVLDEHWMSRCVPFYGKHCNCETDEINHPLSSKLAHFFMFDRITFTACLYVISVGGLETYDIFNPT